MITYKVFYRSGTELVTICIADIEAWEVAWGNDPEITAFYWVED